MAQDGPDVLGLIRTDMESGDLENRNRYAELCHLADWPIRRDLPSYPLRRLIRVSDRMPPTRFVMSLRQYLYRRHAERMVARGLRMLASAKVVVTDRLHGHILSSLIGKPHIVLDNSYGKVSGFIDAWPKDPYTHRATGFEEVRALRDRLLAEVG